jgi:hypothetical protein
MKFENPFTKKMRQKKHRVGSVTRQLIYPMREWGTALIVATLLALALFVLGGLDFYVQYTDNTAPVVSEERIPRYRADDASALIRYYEGRREAFESLRSERAVTPVADPILVEEPEPAYEDSTTEFVNDVVLE